ncbi:MAG: hypothetical protein RL023_695 [Candidatus Parcubacteria bacterium]|jgi:hypothetical protein
MIVDLDQPHGLLVMEDQQEMMARENHSEKKEVMEDQEMEEKNLEDQDLVLLELPEKADLELVKNLEEDESLREDRFDIII